MYICLTMFMIPLIISLIMINIVSIIYKKTLSSREKNTPFECGFDPKSSSRLPFSLQFFLITIIFLIFDVEIALLMPSIIIMNTSNLLLWSSTLTFFIIILLIGLYHEWMNGSLQWTS
uniref:NADH-ubiquinone oxidoreductase chain 3 n=1 Tax=Ornebius bimaculatus TaxID=2153490 RepID=A0A385I1Z6_9ORTH|nr:NADH dehydrogenase subunit 3 [Ornebius bimaculatus]AXY63930.1 NADH dehydrogenase subunit 3 [Ornebius bimaculatus]